MITLTSVVFPRLTTVSAKPIASSSFSMLLDMPSNTSQMSISCCLCMRFSLASESSWNIKYNSNHQLAQSSKKTLGDCSWLIWIRCRDCILNTVNRAFTMKKKKKKKKPKIPSCTHFLLLQQCFVWLVALLDCTSRSIFLFLQVRELPFNSFQGFLADLLLGLWCSDEVFQLSAMVIRHAPQTLVLMIGGNMSTGYTLVTDWVLQNKKL